VFDIITIGSATVDVFAYTDSSEIIKIKSSTSEQDFIAYNSGEKIIITDLDFEIGGGGTNTAVSFSRLGLKTAYLGKIGSDENASKVLELLKKENISFIGARGEKTGYSIVLNSFEHDRTILTYKGANNDLVDSDIVLSNLQTKWFYASSMIGNSFDTLKSIISVIKKTGAKVAFNPSSYQAKRGLSELAIVLKQLDVLVLNKEEAQLLLNEKTNITNDLVKKLALLGPKYVVITDGAKGVTCYYDQTIYYLPASKDVKVVETTGAGDAFASAFVAGLAYLFSVEDSLKLGLIQAESVISAVGAKNNLLFRDDALNQLKVFNRPIQISKTIDEEYIKNTFVAPKGKEFVLQNNQKISDLNELGNSLRTMQDDVFKYHTQSKNHFSLWIKDVFNLTTLSEKLNLIKSKLEMSDVILEYIKQN